MSQYSEFFGQAAKHYYDGSVADAFTIASQESNPAMQVELSTITPGITHDGPGMA